MLRDSTYLVCSSASQIVPFDDSRFQRSVWDRKSKAETPLASLNTYEQSAVLDDSNLIASDIKGNIIVRDLKTGTLRILSGHTDTACALAQDKESFVTASDDKTIRVWVKDGDTCKLKLEGHTGWVRCLQLEGGSEGIIVSGSFDKTVRIWERSSGKCLSILQHQDKVTALLLHSDDVISAAAGIVCIWNKATGVCTNKVPTGSDGVYYLGVLGGKIVAGGDRQIALIDPQSGIVHSWKRDATVKGMWIDNWNIIYKHGKQWKVLQPDIMGQGNLGNLMIQSVEYSSHA